ncbi:MAG: tetratricopeptide repeat protein [Actinoplanes sp.]
MLVFLSHTAELRQFPRDQSYVAAAERAISAAHHVVVDMADFPAVDQAPAAVCQDRVRAAQVYVGILGTRYGSPVRDQPDVSYTELEFDTATEAGLDRLMFLLDPGAAQSGLPVSALIDHEYGARQEAFRARVAGSLTVRYFDHPAQLSQLVERSLRELTDRRRRMDRQLREEQQPADRPLRRSRFVNPQPATVPSWFQGRGPEIDRLADWLADPGVRLVTVTGRGGIGKTAMVCRLLSNLEKESTVAGIVYLSSEGRHPVKYLNLVGDLLRLVPETTVDPRLSPRETMLTLLEEFDRGPVVVLLDNLESVMDTEHETLLEPALHEALQTLLTAPAHQVTVIATTRVAPAGLLPVAPAAQRRLQLTEGLGSPDAETVLRELDDDGTLGLRDAPADVLGGLRDHTRGFPRALEAVKAILENDPTRTPEDLLGRTGGLSADRVVQVLVGEAYDGLDAPAQRVMRALAVFAAPVPAVAVDFLLRATDPTTDAAPVLIRLVRRRLAAFTDGAYHLHATDLDYARAQLPPADLVTLATRGADYYAQIRTPPADRRGLDDVRPQLAEFELRHDAGDFDGAALALEDIDTDFLNAWGHYRTLIGLHERLRGRITDPGLRSWQAIALANSYFGLSLYPRAVETYGAALAEAQSDEVRGSCLSGLGICAYAVGDYQQAVTLQEQALQLARAARDLVAESRYLGNLGNCRLALGDFDKAAALYAETLATAQTLRDSQTEAASLSNLALTDLCTGEFDRALIRQEKALALSRKTGNRLNEGTGLGNLGTARLALGDLPGASAAFAEALAIAEDIGDRHGEACALTAQGTAALQAGDPVSAIPLLTRAIEVADAISDVDPGADARVLLARAHVEAGDPAAALTRTTEAAELPRPTAAPATWVLRGLALRDLDRPAEATEAYRKAVQTAEALLTLTPRNVPALQHRFLASTALSRPTEAAQAYTDLIAVTTAPGPTAETNALLNRIRGGR